jgi:hypothetical protein
MRRNVLASVIQVILLIGSIIFIYSTSASPLSDNHVDATVTCTFDSGSRLTVRTQMLVNRINVFDTMYTRQAIEDMSTTNPYVMGAIMLRVHESMKTQVETAFSNADVNTMNMIPSYQKPYFIDDFQVNLTSAFFGYNGSLNLTNFIAGFLDMGATITYRFNLNAEQGWNTTFLYVLPKTLTLAYANTADTNPETNTVTWMIRNWVGNDAGKAAVLSVQSKNPTTIASEKEDIAIDYIFDTRSLDNISFIDSILLKKIDIRRYNILPQFITGVASLPADGLRLCIENGLFSWSDLFEKTVQPIEQRTTPLIENSSLKQTLHFSFSWDPESTTNCSTPYNITSMDETPALRANFKDPHVQLMICQMPARAFFGLIHSGATAQISSMDLNFGLGLEGLIYPYDIILRLPNNLSLDGKNVYTWNKTTPIMGTFDSDIQPMPPYNAEHTETRIEIELLKMDLNILSALTGKTELTASTKMKEDNRFYVIHRSNSFSFSPKINLTYLNADAFRLCVQENVFSETDIDVFLSGKTTRFQQRLSEIFNGLQVNGIIDRTAFSNSLVWDGDISTMDAVVPIVISNYATEVHTVRFNMSLWPAELTFAPQQFTLQGSENQTVTYRIIFPRGVSVNASETTGKSLITGTTNDGRSYVELAFDAGSMMLSTDLTCVLNASPVYVLSLFLPCILVFILLLVLIVIIYMIRKKKGGLRRGKGKLFAPEDNEPVEYGEQEYYVPPPPPSSKKRK